MKKLFEGGLSEFLKNDKAVKVILAGGFILIAAIFLSDLIGGISAAEPSAVSSQEYEQRAEERLTALISQIKGVKGQITVMVTMDTTEQSVYSERELSEVVYPKIRGVAVICGGADNASVREKVTQVVSKALGVGVSRVCVTT